MGTPSYILPNGKRFDSLHLDELYPDRESKDEAGQRYQKMHEQYWNSSDRMLKGPLDRVQLDLSEMLLLSALIYWDFGITNQSEECIETCQQMRKIVIEELADYEKSKLPHGDHSFRIMEIVGILQCIHKASYVIKECGLVVKIYGLNGKDCPLYEISDG
ncbi:hypothetical protein GCK72_019902 [Caenorhabditis remanei]|uniref:NR LBD domain-containing protein n=2 Tax=Caenorhabditis remanei TaxID=31234 RepID=A0A6A5GF71_CAERE|nr:hypothetical protein GCK72_019902 [Caenorhabditis remanei]KAF1753346.1 hypothetical protein GCK72_019902 [Caenorhabditis remanei]